jgi:hypothetical protein
VIKIYSLRPLKVSTPALFSSPIGAAFRRGAEIGGMIRAAVRGSLSAPEKAIGHDIGRKVQNGSLTGFARLPFDTGTSQVPLSLYLEFKVSFFLQSPSIAASLNHPNLVDYTDEFDRDPCCSSVLDDENQSSPTGQRHPPISVLIFLDLCNSLCFLDPLAPSRHSLRKYFDAGVNTGGNTPTFYLF